jgi:hypothetical protein
MFSYFTRSFYPLRYIYIYINIIRDLAWIFTSSDVDNRHGNHPDESKTLCQVAVLGDLFASRPGDCPIPKEMGYVPYILGWKTNI